MLQKMGDVDLLIENDDLVLDAIGMPQLVTGRACITQDMKNMVRDKGYLVDMMAQRDAQRRAVVMAQITQEAEADVRIKPGSVSVSESTPGVFWLVAESLVYGPIQFIL